MTEFVKDVLKDVKSEFKEAVKLEKLLFILVVLAIAFFVAVVSVDSSSSHSSASASASSQNTQALETGLVLGYVAGKGK